MKKELIYPILLAVVSVAAGLVIGLTIAGNSRYDFSPRFKRKGAFESYMRKKGMGRKDIIFKKISRRLKLSEEQKEEVKNILKSSRSEAKEVFKTSKEKLSALREKTNVSIRAILSKEQQVEFDKMIGEKKCKMSKFKKGERK
ncbi:MAG: hypothetical protein WAQ07_04365 [Candidatus Omnitrophota bacterium]